MAYTKYSLTPANNNAAPPDGAPEGMLPSAVNDTMRDMMAQIRDCGDGIRGGTYTMTAPIITGGSINGATVGASTASTGKFTTLEATGVTTVQAGSASAPAIVTSGDTNTGVWFPAADTIAASTGGTERIRIDSSGRVGIGMTPVANYGSLQIGSSVTSALGVSGLQTYVASGNSALGQNGNISIITTDSQAADIGGSIGFGGKYVAAGTSVLFGHIAGRKENATDNNSAGYLQFATQPNGGTPTERMRIGSSGSVGIGTNNPSLTLNVKSPSDYRVALFETTSTAGPSVQIKGSRIYELRSTDTGASEGGGLFFIYDKTAEASRLTVDSGGSILIGTTARVDSERFSIYVPSASGLAMLCKPQIDGYYASLYRNAANTTVGNIYCSSSGTTYATTSDYRLKENVTPMKEALEVVSKLKPVTYKWKADGSYGQGFIAHELAEVCPEAVVGEKDAVNEDGSIKAQSIDTSYLVATLTAAIQEQQVMIEELKSKVAALEVA